jgi:hypothetical protein
MTLICGQVPTVSGLASRTTERWLLEAAEGSAAPDRFRPTAEDG